MTQVLRLVREVPLTNPDFEGGTTGWSNFGTAATFEQSATQEHSGAYSLHLVTATSAPRGAVSASITIKASTTYYFAAWGRLASGSFKMQVDGNSSGTLVNNVDMGAADNTWRQTFATFTTGASDATVVLYFLSTTAVSEGYFDDVRLYELLADFQDLTDYGLREFSAVGMDSPYGVARLTLDVRGSSLSDFGDNFIKLGRAIKIAEQNRNDYETNNTYAPVWLQWQTAASTYMLQTEVFGLTDDSDGAIDKILAVPQLNLSNRIENINLTLRIRGYFEELTPVQVSGSPFTMDNTTGSATIASLRGDLPAPLRIKVRTATTTQTQMIAALKTRGTPANFLHNFDINTAAGTGYAVTLTSATYPADLTDADLVNGKGVRVTPTTALDAASEIDWLARVIITTNPRDHSGRYHGFLRCRDNHATTPNFYVRVRSILLDSSNARLSYGDYWDIARPALTANSTTSPTQPLIDVGVGNLPLSDFGGTAPYRTGVEILGYSTDTSGHATFDLDELLLLPAHEGEDSGYVSVNLPTALGNGAVPDGVISAFDRAPLGGAYMVDASDVPLVGVDSIAGRPLFAYPNQSQVLYVHTRRLSNGTHTLGINNTVTVDYVPRYRLMRGS